MNRMILIIALLALVAGTAAAQEADVHVNAAQDETTRRSLEIFDSYASEHDASGYADDAVFHDMTLPEPIAGRQAISGMLKSIYEVGFPDAEPEVKSITAVGNRVVLEFVFHGTNTGVLFGNQPTGRTISVPMIAVYRIENELIQEAWLYYDGAGYARQIGWVE